MPHTKKAQKIGPKTIKRNYTFPPPPLQPKFSWSNDDIDSRDTRTEPTQMVLKLHISQKKKRNTEKFCRFPLFDSAPNSRTQKKKNHFFVPIDLLTSLSLSLPLFSSSLSANCYFPNFLFLLLLRCNFQAVFFSFRPRKGILRRFLRGKPSKGGGGIGEIKGRRVGEIPWF